MSNYIIKTYHFKTKSEVGKDAFLVVSAQVDAYLLEVEGFVYRSVAQVTEYEWLDCVYWSSAEAAQAGGDAAMEQPFMEAFMACIDPATVVYTEAVIATQAYPEMHQAPPQ